MNQDFRSFLKLVEETVPTEFKRISQEVSPAYEVTALVMEYEKIGQHPLLVFENVKGYEIPVATNVVSTRRRYAMAMGVQERQLAQVACRRSKTRLAPKLLPEAPFQENVYLGDQVDLNRFPILTHFPIDGGPYITAGLVVAKDPYSGASTLGYHRMQLKGKDRLGISLHSRKRMWEYQGRAEAMGKNLEAAVIIGNHPVLSLGSMALLPYHESKFELLGGLFGEPLEVVQARTIDLAVPAGSEIVIEGEILSGVREPEGPFGEFTGYACFRSTEHVFHVKAILHRDRPIFQSICAGLCGDHTTAPAVQREADLLEAVQRTVPNVRDVHVPKSGCGIFHAYISIRKTAEGQPLQAIFAALGIDMGVKLVVVVDDDIDVCNESEVLWAISTRLQASRGVHITPGAMGVILDPSSTEDGRSDKMGIDATKPLAKFATNLTLPDEVTQNARKLM
ncbi:MAG: UbiD family decarboxylase [Chloroflexi bacterium]|nr:UbiD family decarboxylase [Chloroflexota bacterium]